MSFIRVYFTCSFVMLGQLFAVSNLELWDHLESQMERNYEIACAKVGNPIKTEFPGRFVKEEFGVLHYYFPETRSYLYALTSPAQRLGLLNKIDFCIRLYLSYARQFVEVDAKNDDDGVVYAAQATVSIKILNQIAKILDSIMNKDCALEEDLMDVYVSIMAYIRQLSLETSIDEINKESLTTFYSAIKDWIREFFPLSHMIKYLKIEMISEAHSPDSPGNRLSRVTRFQGGDYRDDFKKTEAYKRIENWIKESGKSGKKGSSLLCNQASHDLMAFNKKIFVQFNPSDLPLEANINIAFIRFLESIYSEGEELLTKWNNVIDNEAAEKEQAAQARKAARVANTNQPPKVDPREALAAMMAALELSDDKTSAPTARASKPKPKAVGAPKKPTNAQRETQDLAAKQHAEDEARLKAERQASEAMAAAQLAETEAANAAHNAAQKQRQQALAERRAAAAAESEAQRRALSKRKKIWLDDLYAEEEKLSPFDRTQLVDPKIFDGAADFVAACTEMKAKGIYLGLRIHGNEKCVAMWKDKKGRNVMVWFDAPHGAQVQKGSMAAWSIGLHKALRDSGRLLSGN